MPVLKPEDPSSSLSPLPFSPFLSLTISPVHAGTYGRMINFTGWYEGSQADKHVFIHFELNKYSVQMYRVSGTVKHTASQRRHTRLAS